MISIVASPLLHEEALDSTPVSLEIFLPNEQFVGKYDQLEVWRSIVGSSGPYSEKTADGFKAARLPTDADDPGSAPAGAQAELDGKSIDFLLNELNSLSVTFAGVDPISFVDAAAQIITQGQGKVTAYVTDDGVFVVETVQAGSGASIRITDGDAAPLLGLPVDSLATGRDNRITLIADKYHYGYVDEISSKEYYYKVRLRNSSTGMTSEFSQYFSIGNRLGLDPTTLVLGRVSLVTVDGKPLVHQEVRVSGKFSMVGDKIVAGSDQVRSTDLDGKAEFVLIRGERVTVAIPGTSLVRTITVPTDATVETFNLMDPTISDDDIFTVQVPNLIMAERRDL